MPFFNFLREFLVQNFEKNKATDSQKFPHVFQNMYGTKKGINFVFFGIIKRRVNTQILMILAKLKIKSFSSVGYLVLQQNIYGRQQN